MANTAHPPRKITQDPTLLKTYAMKKILLTAVLIGAMFSVSAYVVCVAAPL